METKEIIKRLKKLYPEPIVELDYTTPFELLIASLLAASVTIGRRAMNPGSRLRSYEQNTEQLFAYGALGG